MADRKISELAAASTVGSSDLTVLVQSNVTKKVPLSILLDGNLVNQNSLPVATPNSEDYLITIQGGINKKVTVSEIQTYITNQITDSTAFSSGNSIVWIEGTALKKYPVSSILIGENVNNTGLLQSTVQNSSKFLVISTDGSNQTLAVNDLLTNVPINHSGLAQNTSPNSTDDFLIVAGGITKKISFDNIFSNLPYPPLIASSETFSTSDFVASSEVYVSKFDSGTEISGTLSSGNLLGKIQNKYLVNVGTAVAVISVTGNNFTTVTIQPKGLVQLVWIDSTWWISSEVGATHG